MITPAEGSTTANDQPTIEGTGEAGATLVLTINGQILTTTVDSNGSWTISPAPLPDGSYRPQLTITDEAGNSTGPTEGNGFTVRKQDSTGREDSLVIFLPMINN